MNKARSIGLAVQYRSTPYSAQVQASAQVDAAEGGGSAASSASSGSGAAAGQAVTLNNTPLYVSSVAKNPATHKTGLRRRPPVRRTRRWVRARERTSAFPSRA